MMPGIKLTAVTALVPIMNVAVATKSVLAGHANALLLAEMFVSLAVVALISIVACSRLFERESTIFRGI